MHTCHDVHAKGQRTTTGVSHCLPLWGGVSCLPPCEPGYVAIELSGILPSVSWLCYASLRARDKGVYYHRGQVGSGDVHWRLHTYMVRVLPTEQSPQPLNLPSLNFLRLEKEVGRWRTETPILFKLLNRWDPLSHSENSDVLGRSSSNKTM